jgi:hypothetical protein
MGTASRIGVTLADVGLAEKQPGGRCNTAGDLEWAKSLNGGRRVRVGVDVLND